MNAPTAAFCRNCGTALKEAAPAPASAAEPAATGLTLATRGQRFGAFLIDFVITTVVGVLIAVLGLVGGGKFLVTLIYFPAFTLAFGATPGKMAMGIRVADAEGRPLPTPRILLREVLGRWLAIICFGHIWLLFNKDRKNVWDFLAGSVVVQRRQS